MAETWEDFTFEESKSTKSTVRFLNLPNSVMENICRFLPTQKDKYTSCLIHRQWTAAAQNVLWESISFELPAAFRSFISSIQALKKLALLVRDVQLVFATHEDSIFQPITKSTIDRHIENNPLDNSNFVTCIARSCDRIKAFTFYGWNLKDDVMDKLSTVSSELISIHIIGNPTSDKPFLLYGLLNRLTCLRLDGNFNINERWAETLVNKGKCIQILQLSLKNLHINTVAKICTANGLISLIDLTFTDANMLLDHHVKLIVEAFPNLTKLCLEGTVQITSLSIAHSLSICSRLNSLELRADIGTLNHQHLERQHIAEFNNIIYNHVHSTPNKFLLENSNIDDNQLSALSPYLNSVQTIGFKNCPKITNEGVKAVLESMRYLRTIQIIQCESVDSALFTILSNMEDITKSLFRIRLESCGQVNGKDIYEFSCQCVYYNLRQITLVNYPEIQQTAIGNYSEEAGYGNNLTLSRACIDALFHSDDPEFCTIPEGRFLSGKQLLLLARNLDISIDELIDILDRLDIECKKVNFIQLCLEPFESRLYSLKYKNSSQRPTTPTLWSNDFERDQIIYDSESNSDERFNKSETDDTFNQEYEDEEDQTEEEEYKDERDTLSPKWNDHDSNSLNNTSSEINLGGGGWGGIEGWSTSGKSQNSRDPVSAHGYTQSSTSLQKPQNSWIGFKEEAYKEQWQQTNMEVNATQVFSKRGKQKRFRNSPVVAESDDWGAPEKVIPWDDLQTQGYAKEVIDQQQKTQFWTQVGNEWTKATASTSTNTTNETDDDNSLTVVSGNSTPAAANSPPLLFSAYANDVQNKLNNAQSSKNTSRNSQQNVTSRHITAPPRARSNSLISSDGGVSWNDDNPVSIKLGNNEPTIIPNATTTTRFPTARRTTDANARSKWASAEEWKATKETGPPETTTTTTTTTTSSTYKQSSWQNNFSPEEVADKTAKNEWSTMANNNISPSHSTRRNFSRPHRASNPRYSSREPVNNSWGEFSNNPTNIFPPYRSLTSSPPNRKSQIVYQKPATPAALIVQDLLVDTDNTPSSSSRQSLKGDVWESIGTLDIPNASRDTNEVLVPQGATATKPRGPISTQITDWSLDSSEESEPFRFQDTIAGMVTEEEIRAEKKSKEMDDLVDFGDLVALQPSNNTHSPQNNSSLDTPVPKTPQISSNLVSMYQMDNNTHSTQLMDFTSLADEATTKNNVSNSSHNDHITDISFLVAQKSPKNDIPDFTSLIPQAPHSSNNVPESPSPAKKTHSDENLMDFTSFVAKASPSPVVPTASINTLTDTNTAVSSLKEEAAYITDTSVGSTPEIPEKKSKVFSYRIKVRDEQIQFRISIDDDLKAVVQKFCDDHDCSEVFKQLYELAENTKISYETKKILGKTK